MNIPEIGRRIKSLWEGIVHEWGIVIIVILIGLASFGLGRLSALEDARPAVSAVEADAGRARAMYVGGEVVASRNGSAYHYPWCPGAQSMSPANKIWFASEEAARRAGYSPAKNCKGLQ